MSKVWLVFVILCTGGVLSNLSDGKTGGAITGTFITLFFIWLWRRAVSKKKNSPAPAQAKKPTSKAATPKAAKSKQAKPARPAPAASDPVAKAPRPAKAPVLSAKDKMVDSIAERLRALATTYEDLTKQDVLVQQNLYIDRITKATSVQGPAVFVIRRSGFHIEFMNQNTRTGKVNKIDKTWSQIHGCLPHDYSLYFKDDTMVTFSPRNQEESLFFDVAWQVFADAMNGESYQFMDPKASGIGPQLRDVARYIQEHRSEVAKLNKFNIESVPRTVEPEILPTENTLKSPPKAGDIVGGYKLVEQLGGQSGFGMVFKSVNLTDQSDIAAVKIMRLQDGVKPGTPDFHAAAEDFMNEAKLSNNYTHVPFVVTALDYDTNPWPWIRYPLVQGKTVSSIVESGNRFTGSQWWELAHDMLAGLSEIHDDGMIHRDIKWDNVMVTKECAKILDFGLSQVSDYLGDRISAAHARPFAAPEIISIRTAADIASLTPKADIYGVGLVLYMARVGQQLPYQISREWNAAQTLEARKSTVIQPGFFDDEELGLISRMLAFDAESRISAREALKIVASHVDLEPKIVLFEEALLRAYLHKASEPVADFETTESMTLAGPFKSWQPIEELLKTVMETKRPRYFSADFNFNDGKEFVYVQGYFDGGGWSIECMSEKFTERSHSQEQKRTFINLGWNPPTSESPNYQRDTKGTDSLKPIAMFIDAFEQGYKVNPHQIANVAVSMQGPGHF